MNIQLLKEKIRKNKKLIEGRDVPIEKTTFIQEPEPTYTKLNGRRIIYNADKNLAEIYFDYDHEIVKEVKQIKDRKWNPIKIRWEVKPAKDNYSLFESFIERNDFSCSDELIDRLQILKIEKKRENELRKKNLKSSQSFVSGIKVKGLKKELYPFQRAGVEYASKNKKVIIGDCPGLGKTMEAIATIQHLLAYPNITVCPSVVKYNWQNEWNSWVNRKVVIVDTSDSEKKVLDKVLNHEVVIMNYHSITKFQEILKKINFASMIVDESHMAKSSKTKRTKAVKKIARKLDVVLELTGTVVTNKPVELISQLEILGKLGDFGGYWPFINRYTNPQRTYWGLDMSGASNLDELHEKLRSICYIRREKNEVLKELPDKQRVILDVDISNREEYNQAEDDLVSYFRSTQFEDKKIRNEISKIKDPIERKKALREYGEKKAQSAQQAEHLVRINVLRKLSAEGKMKESFNWIDNFLETGEKLVVFAHHTDIVDRVRDKYKCNKIDGSVKDKKRQEIIDDFQKNPEPNLLVCNIKAGGVGITLTAASNVVFLELPWTPSEIEQAIDRLHRIGQKNSVNAYFLLGENTIDKDIYDLIENKRLITQQIISGEIEDLKVLRVMDELINKMINK